MLLLARVGQWSWKIKEDVRTLETRGGSFRRGRDFPVGAVTREIIWNQRKCKLQKKREEVRPREKMGPVRGHFWNQREELELALESPAFWGHG